MIDLILSYGESRLAWDGTRKHALSGKNLRQIRRVYGHEIAKALGAFRTAYFAETEVHIVTVAYARQLLSLEETFHGRRPIS